MTLKNFKRTAINVLKHITTFLKKKEVKKYFSNTSWLMGEKIITMSLLMLVSIFVARHLGAEGYGVLSYAISLVSLFTIATHMGLHGLAIRELVRFPDSHTDLLGTIFYLKFMGAVFAILVFLTIILSTESVGSTQFWVLLVTSGIILFKPFEIFDYWFQSQVMAKYSAITRGMAAVFFTILSVLLVVISAHILAFAFSYLIQAILIALLFLFFFRQKSIIKLKELRFKLAKAIDLLGNSWMIMIGALFAMVYLKIDQVMLRWLVNTEEVGIYSVAVNLSEIWYFIPTLIVASIFPKLIELQHEDKQRFQKRLQQLFDILFMIAISLAIVVTFISEPLILFLYGVEFEKAALILSIHVWAGIFIFMRAAFSKWILLEDAIPISMITQGTGALLNILLNIMMIPIYEGAGAAMATIISYAAASYFSLLFFKKSRLIFWMMTKALLSPFRYIYIILK